MTIPAPSFRATCRLTTLALFLAVTPVGAEAVLKPLRNAALGAPATAPSTGGADWWWTLPLFLALAVAVHTLVGRGFKAIISASQPLASGATEVGGYERTVYGTADRASREVVGLVLASGLLMWLGAVLVLGWVGLLGGLVLVGALALDLKRWERVTVSADCVWFQRGLGQKVHQVLIDNIRDITITEADAPGLTLRHGRHNSLCRLNLRMLDKRIVALPKTDTRSGLDAVETVANHIRTRQQLVHARPAAPPSPSQFDSPDTIPASRIRHASTQH